jgi:hypothetical protein
MIKVLVLSLLLIKISISEIDIWGPPQLKKLYRKKVIEYSIANFGVVPYGKSIIGTLKKSVPFDACKDIKNIRNTLSDGALILLVSRGGCHFAEKVINAQKIGASLVILVDNEKEDVHDIMPVERGENLMNQVCLYKQSP